MANRERTDQLSEFQTTGIHRFDNSTAVFIDPVRILNRSYSRFRVSPSSYYSRFFNQTQNPNSSTNPKKRKLNAQTLNERELIAENRHQEVRPMLLKAHEALLGAKELLEAMRNLSCDEEECGEYTKLRPSNQNDEVAFVKLGSVWQAQFYEITLNFDEDEKGSAQQTVVPIFNNLVSNEGSSEVEAEFLSHKYIIPKQSCFYMIDNLIPAESDSGFNLIVIDPPWENSSAHQKSREKLRSFVENELFPSWGVKHVATFHWLKVKADGSLISELDLFHHRPYECLLLGYCHPKDADSEYLSRLNPIPEDQVFISIPGEYSRKPPIGELLQEYAPGSQPTRCIELFAREMIAGWTSWGNEPLHFQDSRLFVHKRLNNNDPT